MRESRVERALVVGITALGGMAEKFSSPARRGVPDRLVSWPETHDNAWTGWDSPNRPLVEFIETKAPGGKLSPPQVRDHARRRAMGFTVHVLWNLEQVEAYLKYRGKK